MKKAAIFLACSIALSLIFYEAADYLIPGSPSEEMTLLLAGIAFVIVWVAQCFIRVSRPKKSSTHRTAH